MRRHFDPVTAWTVGGVVASVLTTVCFGLLALLTDIQAWASNNQGWLLPLTYSITLITMICFGLILGYYFSCRNSKVGPAIIEKAGMTLREMWKKEASANVVWVISPALYYDARDHNCQETVKKNRKERNVSYSYIIEDNTTTKDRLEEYKREHALSDDKQFLKLPATSEMNQFQIEIVIYDPYQDNTLAFGYPHESELKNADVIEFDSDITDLYTQRFNKLWLEKKKKRPPVSRG